MENVQIIVEYDGTAYCGWQVQHNGLAIQQVLMDAWEKMTGERIKLAGSGRTDAGVHAYGQSANFLTGSTIPVEKIPYAWNGNLPPDIRVLEAKIRGSDFHSRFSAKGKVYEYRVLNRAQGSGLRYNRVWHVRQPLDFDRMDRAKEHFIGTHDFTAFSSAKSEATTKVRTVHELVLSKEEEEYVFVIAGNGFLYNMVRIMVGTLVEIGQGKREPESILDLFEGKERRASGITAPPQGLYLKKVIY